MPRFLPDIPLDPADDQPLRYSREKRIVYGIGSDSLDSGGSSKADPEEARDDPLEPTFRLITGGD